MLHEYNSLSQKFYSIFCDILFDNILQSRGHNFARNWHLREYQKIIIEQKFFFIFIKFTNKDSLISLRLKTKFETKSQTMIHIFVVIGNKFFTKCIILLKFSRIFKSRLRSKSKSDLLVSLQFRNKSSPVRRASLNPLYHGYSRVC